MSDPAKGTHFDPAYFVEYDENLRAWHRALAPLLTPQMLEFWRSMPSDWTDVTTLAGRENLSTVSIRLKRLHDAGAVLRMRDEQNGQRILYRPVSRVCVKFEVLRHAD